MPAFAGPDAVPKIPFLLITFAVARYAGVTRVRTTISTGL
jgi:hypothetical protein